MLTGDGGFELQTDETWIEPLDIGWRLGVDALSAPLIVLTARADVVLRDRDVPAGAELRGPSGRCWRWCC